MSMPFEFEQDAWSRQGAAEMQQFGSGEAEWQGEYGRVGPPPAAPARPYRARPATPMRPPGRPRWPARPRFTAFPVIPWGAWPPGDEPPAEPSADAFEPADSSELLAFETSSRSTVTPKVMSAAACGFDPAKHAFRFVNSFDFPPVMINALKKLPFHVTLGSRRMGLCGGMSCLAADYCSFGMQVPSTVTAAPNPNDKLYWRIVARQMDSLNLTGPLSKDEMGAPIRKFLLWMSLPDSSWLGVSGTKALTTVEVTKAKSLLRQGKFAALGLVRKSMYSDGPMALFDNHQIVAHGFSEPSPTVTVFKIYDPNFEYDPLHRNYANLTIKATRTGDETTCEELTAIGSPQEPIRGFFVLPYTPVKP